VRKRAVVEAPKHGGYRANSGRKPGVRMRCGECGAALTAREWRDHFTECPNRPKEDAA